MKFKTKIIREAGYEEALLGISLSYNTDVGKMPGIAEKLANKDGGHNKFLESIVVWIDITAARYWWQQASTYRHTSVQSQSTMHTMMKHKLTKDDFEQYENSVYDTVPYDIIDWLNDEIHKGLFLRVKMCLPEAFLQRRIVCTNYKSLRNMILQRRNHKLPEWQIFCASVLNGVKHPELLPDIELS